MRCGLVGNHCQMYGPIAAELYLSRPHYIWCVREMMNREEVPAYAFRDFWSMKPKTLQWMKDLQQAGYIYRKKEESLT